MVTVVNFGMARQLIDKWPAILPKSRSATGLVTRSRYAAVELQCLFREMEAHGLELARAWLDRKSAWGYT